MVAQIISMSSPDTAPVFVGRKPIPYGEKVKLARKMRKNPTIGEWRMLSLIESVNEYFKAKKSEFRQPFEFEHQSIECGYIVDFYIPSLRLAIEVDGNSHFGREEQDKIRDRNLNSGGIIVVRFSDHDLKHRLNDCYKRFMKILVEADFFNQCPEFLVPKSKLERLGASVPEGKTMPNYDPGYAKHLKELEAKKHEQNSLH